MVDQELRARGRLQDPAGVVDLGEGRRAPVAAERVA